MPKDAAELFQRFVEVIKALRTPVTGCPWDLEQTHESIRPYLIEEAYEVLDAIEAKNDNELALELGDLLLQVVLHAQIASDRNAFDISTVVKHVTEKMIRRHPHVFGDTKVDGAAQVLKNWEAIKLEEKQSTPEKGNNISPLFSGVPKGMPALLRAQRLGEKANKVGFDWDKLSGVWEKVKEEVGEVEQEIKALSEGENAATKNRIGEEIGDLLFALCQFSRWLELSAEDCLKGSADRFVYRFSAMERLAQSPLSGMNIEELEALWQRAKGELK